MWKEAVFASGRDSCPRGVTGREGGGPGASLCLVNHIVRTAPLCLCSHSQTCPSLVRRLFLCELWASCTVSSQLWATAFPVLPASLHMVLHGAPGMGKRGPSSSRWPAHLPFICSWLADFALRGCRALDRRQDSKDLWPLRKVSRTFPEIPPALHCRRVLWVGGI